MDFNIYDVFKNQTDEEGNPKTFDPQILLIENLDKKVMEKFKYIDTHVKALESGAKTDKENIRKLQDKFFKIENAFKKISEALSKSQGIDLKLDLDEDESPYARMEDVKVYVEQQINE